MKCYRSFLIRCWLIEDSQQIEKKVIDVEHIQSGDHTRVADMTEAEEWMFAVSRRATAGLKTLTKKTGSDETPEIQLS